MTRITKSTLAFALVALASLSVPTKSAAQTLLTPTCAWPFEWTAFGPGNWLFADTGNRWWYMPIDPQWKSLKITGVYPKARFFSFAIYDDAPVATAMADHMFDAELEPDQGSTNPFHTGTTDTAQTYTVTVTRSEGTVGNALRLNAKSGWLLYRLYLPNAGEGSMGGVPLPSVSITDSNGQEAPLPTCPTVNRQSELAALQPQFVPSLLESPPVTPSTPDQIWFAPLPSPPVRLLPNPDNKYMVSFFMSEYKPEKIIVIRGKMPAYPDTYRGAPVSQPAEGFSTVQMRYWSMCLGALTSPLPITGCAVDASTPLDEDRFYTVVISNDVLRPEWLSPEDVWIPWGDEQMFPKTVFVRNTLPSSDFRESVQEAVAKGCGVEFNFPVPPTPDGITEAGKCSKNVMGEYYPAAVWCDKADFMQKGWRSCFR